MQEEFEYTGKAMGTTFSIALIGSDKSIADTYAAWAISEIEAYEKRFSRFLPDSELSELNRQKQLVVSDIFFDVVTHAYALFEKTKGIFNPLIQVERLGYDKSFDMLANTAVSAEDEIYDIDFSTVILEKGLRRVTLGEDQKLDFGGFLKGYLATKLCEELDTKKLFTGIIVNIGGDLHTVGTDAEDKPFVFEIYNPVTDTDIPLTLKDTSLATSGTYKRSWQTGKQMFHHIVGKDGIHNPDSDIVSASIMHPDGAFAEAYAKVFISAEPAIAQLIINDQRTRFLIIKSDGTTTHS